MPRKTKKGELDRRHGGYRHGVPGGKPERVEVRVTPDVKERWRAAAERAGFVGQRDFAAFIVDSIEHSIATRGLDKPGDYADLREKSSRGRDDS